MGLAKRGVEAVGLALVRLFSLLSELHHNWFPRWHLMSSNGWPFLCTSFDIALDGLPADRPTAGANGTNQDHAIMEAEMIQQLVMSVAHLIAIGAKPG